MTHYVVCTKGGPWVATHHGDEIDTLHPVKGQIYRVQNLICADNKLYYLLRGFNSVYSVESFRDCDHTFGHLVCETILQQIAYERAATL